MSNCDTFSRLEYCSNSYELIHTLLNNGGGLCRSLEFAAFFFFFLPWGALFSLFFCPNFGLFYQAAWAFRWLSGKEPTCQCRRYKRCGFDPWLQKILWKRKWQPTPIFLPGEFHGQRSLAGYSQWDCKELDTTEWAQAHLAALVSSYTQLHLNSRSSLGYELIAPHCTVDWKIS